MNMSETANDQGGQTSSGVVGTPSRHDDADKMTSTSTDGTVRSVRRALDILNLFSEDQMVLTVRETTLATGLPKTTVLRMLQTLEYEGLLWPLGAGQYSPGPALLHWARIANDSWLLPPNFRETMVDLSELCRETVNVYVRKGLRRVCIAQAPGPQSLRHVVKVGDELPLWAGASAKILLANSSRAIIDAVAAESPPGAAQLDTLLMWCEQVGERGWAQSHAERDDGVSAVAVPIRARDGTVVAALSLSGPTSRFTEERVGVFVHELTKAAATLHQQAPEEGSAATSLFPRPQKGENA